MTTATTRPVATAEVREDARLGNESGASTAIHMNNGTAQNDGPSTFENRRATGPIASMGAAPFGDDKATGTGGGYTDYTEHHGFRTASKIPSVVELDSYRRRASVPFQQAQPWHPASWDPEAVQRVVVTDWSAAIGNPSPFGLYCFSVASIIFGFINIGGEPAGPFIMLGMNWGIIHAGVGQILAGIFELNKGQTFAGTTFTTFGLFWVGLGLYYLEIILGIVPIAATEAEARWPYFISFLTWGLIAASIFVITTRHSVCLMLIFGFATLSFIGSALSRFSNVLGIIGGAFSLALGLVGIYTGTAVLVDETVGRMILPIGLIGVPGKKKQ